MRNATWEIKRFKIALEKSKWHTFSRGQQDAPSRDGLAVCDHRDLLDRRPPRRIDSLGFARPSTFYCGRNLCRRDTSKDSIWNILIWIDSSSLPQDGINRGWGGDGDSRGGQRRKFPMRKNSLWWV